MQFFIDGTLIGTDTSSSYTCSIDNKKYTNGAHTLKAVVADFGQPDRRDPDRDQHQRRHRQHAARQPGAGRQLQVARQRLQDRERRFAQHLRSERHGRERHRRIEFFMNSTLYVTERIAPYTCGFGSGKFADGNYTLKAVAYDKLGAKSEAQISLVVGGGSTTPRRPTRRRRSASARRPPVPSSPARPGLSGTATDTGGSVAKVEMYVGSKLVDTKTSAPYSGAIDTTTLPNGTATLMAVATDNLGATATVQRSVTIENTVVTPPTDPNPQPGTGTNLPSTNARAVATFESLGMYWKPGSNPGSRRLQRALPQERTSRVAQACRCGTTRATASAAAASCTSRPAPTTRCEFNLPAQAFTARRHLHDLGEAASRSRGPSPCASGSATLNITQGGTAPATSSTTARRARRRQRRATTTSPSTPRT